MVESSWLWEWYSRIKHQYNREQNQGLQLNPALHCSSSTITTAGSWLETFCSQVQLGAVYLGHKAELPAPAPQPLTLCVCQGCHTILGLTKASLGHQCPAARASSQHSRGCQTFALQHQDKGTQRCQDMSKPLQYQHGAESSFPNCHIPEQTDLQVFSFTALTSCTSTWPITLFYSAKVSKNFQKLTKRMSPPECPALCSPLFWTSHPCLFKEQVIDAPDFSR